MYSIDVCQLFVTGKVNSEPLLQGGSDEPFMCSFELAVSDLFETCYFRVLVKGEEAEACSVELQVGDYVAVTGLLKPEYWDGPGKGKIREIWIAEAGVHYLPTGPVTGPAKGRVSGQPEVPVP